MYIPPLYAESDESTLFDFIDAHPFGVLVTATPDGPFATHLPLVLDRARRVLEGHVARANPHHRLPLAAPDALAIFAGPDAYISRRGTRPRRSTAASCRRGTTSRCTFTGRCASSTMRPSWRGISRR